MTESHHSEPVIRAARSTDVPAIARIWRDGWADGHAGHVPEELYRHRTADTYPARVRDRLDRTWLAERDGIITGFVVVVGDEVEQVYVDAAARGTGVAAMLLEHAERVVAGAGHQLAWLAVVAGNARARAFYERSGWRDTGLLDYEAETATGFVIVPCRRYEKVLAETDAAPRRA
ncbi:GNAT family N-acetyltransferase [Agromyces sp. H66]|uniref:GNAT family N-acetyltransferase n=1 Tax=Agromyces sp. H66 TaxID=2529859 RepID=UPI0010AA38FA|nr:GNAT family N-acetyltransferase [Agromyces sp. H66]